MSEIKDDLMSEKTVVKGDIYLSDIGKFKNLIEDINKRAKKLQCPPITFELGDVFVKPVMIRNAYGEYVTKKIKMLPVTVTGEIPKIPGYFALARIEKTNTECLITPLTSTDKQFDESWKKHDMHCDHCGHKRSRNSVWIIKEESSGKELSIGDSCIDEFLPRFNTKAFINRCSLFIDLKEAMHSWEEYAPEEPSHLPRKIVLAIAIAVIKKQGFQSVQKAQEAGPNSRIAATSEIVSLRASKYLSAETEEREEVSAELFTSEDLRIACDSLAQKDEILAKISFNPSIRHNLSVILDDSSGISALSEIPRLCLFAKFACDHFLVPTEFSQEPAQAKKQSNFVGTVGDKIMTKVKVVKKFLFDKFDGATGSAIIMEDPEGNILVTYPSRFNPEMGAELVIKGTIKSHKTFKGENQTVLLRVATVSSDEADKIFESLGGLKHEEEYDRADRRLISSGGYLDEVMSKVTEGTVDNKVFPIVRDLERAVEEGKSKGEYYFELRHWIKKVQLEIKIYVFVEWELKGKNISFRYQVLKGKPKNLSKAIVYEV